MRASLALCVAAALIGAVYAECGACIDGQCYRWHPLPGITGELMDINRNTNTLYMNGQLCQLDTGRCNQINNTWNVLWRLTIDQRSGDIYGKIHDDTGINLYKLNVSNNEKQLLVRNVKLMTIKDKLYYSLRYGNGIFTYENGESLTVPGSEEQDVADFIVDKNDDIYFKSSYTGEFRRLSKGVVDRIEHSERSYFITVDKDGNAVFFNTDSHAVYKVTDGHLTEVGAIDGSTYYPLLFDGDNNVIYRNINQDYFHLKRDSGVNCTIFISQNTTVITETVATMDTYPEKASINTTPSIEITTSSSADEDELSPSTPESTTSSQPDSGNYFSGAPGQQLCNCRCPKLPNISINVKFN